MGSGSAPDFLVGSVMLGRLRALSGRFRFAIFRRLILPSDRVKGSGADLQGELWPPALTVAVGCFAEVKGLHQAGGSRRPADQVPSEC